MLDMRYMWSEIDSMGSILKRRQPSREVVFRRLMRWKRGGRNRGGLSDRSVNMG